jgi:23S rRNA pseudouridine1911/1915/1917 synthase
MIELVAAEPDGGRRLDVVLAAHPAIGSRAKAQKLIDAGLVSVNGRPRQKRHAVVPGERIQVDDEPEAELDARGGADVDFAVAYEDDDLIVVDKPAGLVVHPAPAHPTGTLAQALAGRAAGGEAFRPGIVHRLDRDTSGLMIVARNEEAHRRLSDAIRKHEVERTYLALVEGRPRSRSGTIDAPLGRDHRAPERRAVGGRGSREARTHFKVLEAAGEDTLVEVRLETGRTHQVRAHFAAIGHPLCGDPRYGHSGRHGLRRQFLHSHRLGFAHPHTGERLAFRSDLPSDLVAALERARTPG